MRRSLQKVICLKIWQKTGSLLTADGSDDDLVKPEGLPDYKVPPPLEYLELNPAPPTSNTPSSPENVNEDELADVIETEEPENSKNDIVDEEDDRIYDYGFVGLLSKHCTQMDGSSEISSIITRIRRIPG